MVSQTCSCGAIITGSKDADVQAAMDAHKQVVHGQEPDALQKRIQALEAENAALKAAAKPTT